MSLANQTDYRPDIDGLRAIAVLAVVVFHWHAAWLPAGFVGVDIFFVISGYLISKIILSEISAGRFSIARFYQRRILRIFPALLAMVASSLAFGWYALYSTEFEMMASHAARAFAFVLNFKLASEWGYFDIGSDFKPLLHLWSLSVEEQFYFVFPLLLMFFRKHLSEAWKIGLFFAFSFALGLYYSKTQPGLAFYFSPGRFWEMAAGGFLALVVYRGWAPATRAFTEILGAMGLIMLALSIVIIPHGEAFPGWWALLPVFGSVFTIASGVRSHDSLSARSFASRLLSNPVAVWIGLISYPLYLWHWPLLSFVRILNPWQTPLLLESLAIVSAFALAAATYYLIERPIRFSKRRMFWTYALSAGVLILAIFAGVVANLEGVPSRSVNAGVAAIAHQAREERTDSACLASIETALNEKPQFAYCRLSSAGARPPEILLIGDSHAHAIFPGLAKMLEVQGQGLQLLANSSCPPLMGVGTEFEPAVQAECDRQTEQILRFVDQNQKALKVIVATRGDVYLTGKGFGPAERHLKKPSVYHLKDGTNQNPTAIFAEGLIATTQRIETRGKKVIYLTQVPEVGVQPLDCSTRPVIGASSHGCQRTIESVMEAQRDYRNAIQTVAKETHLKVVDLVPGLCPDGICLPVRDGNQLYIDDNHLNSRGAVLAIEAVEKQLFDLGIK